MGFNSAFKGLNIVLYIMSRHDSGLVSVLNSIFQTPVVSYHHHHGIGWRCSHSSLVFKDLFLYIISES